MAHSASNSCRRGHGVRAKITTLIRPRNARIPPAAASSGAANENGKNAMPSTIAPTSASDAARTPEGQRGCVRIERIQIRKPQ